MVTYKVLCNADLNKKICLEELLANEKIAKIIKSEFADILVLAEEDAAEKKLLKKDCDRVELVNIKTTS